jgi:hypothetical protein
VALDLGGNERRTKDDACADRHDEGQRLEDRDEWPQRVQIGVGGTGGLRAQRGLAVVGGHPWAVPAAHR